jgi:hypothetical protein
MSPTHKHIARVEVISPLLAAAAHAQSNLFAREIIKITQQTLWSAKRQIFDRKLAVKKASIYLSLYFFSFLAY